MLGIKLKYECPACGNLLTTSAPFWNEDYRKKFKDPIKKCSCGRKGSFTLVNFEPCQFAVIDEKAKEETADDKPSPETSNDEETGEIFN